MAAGADEGIVPAGGVGCLDAWTLAFMDGSTPRSTLRMLAKAPSEGSCDAWKTSTVYQPSHVRMLPARWRGRWSSHTGNRIPPPFHRRSIGSPNFLLSLGEHPERPAGSNHGVGAGNRLFVAVLGRIVDWFLSPQSQ
jgi:hypothetical protein